MLSQDDFVIAALLEEGLLDRAKVEQARRHAADHSVSPCESVIALAMIDPRQLAIVRAQTAEFPYVDLSHYEIDFANTSLLPRSTAENIVAFPLFVTPDTITVGMANPLDLKAVDQLRTLLKLEVEAVLCEPEAIRGLIERAYSLTGSRSHGRAGSSVIGGDAAAELTTGKEPIVAAVNQIIAQGIDLGASDIHIGPDEHELHLRYRVDGSLRAHQGPGIEAHGGIVQRLKVMANLDLTQTRRPQDGKFRYVHNGHPVDIRLSLIPTVSGENTVMRLLASSANVRDFASLGFPQSETAQFEELINAPYGMILVTGPTGSGKTTTLYTALKRLNTIDTNIVTVEDPVEIRMPLIRQVQVNPEIGMNFAGALRSILRQDPDVVFVGEIRDEETARISIQAALTGHLVLSSLHTNDAAGAIPRLRDLGCPSFAVNAALLCVIAQRLVKRVCPDCAKPRTPDEALLRKFGVTARDGQFVRGEGCGRCSSSGSRGRTGIYELFRSTPVVKAAIEREAGAVELRKAADESGMRPMWQDGLEKAKIGLTTLDEIARVVAVQSTADDLTDPATKRPSEDVRRIAA